MSAFQRFGATNAPDACKWCGRALRHEYKTIWEYQEASRCQKCGSTNLQQSSSNATTQYAKSYECRDCYAYGQGPRKVVSREQTSHKPGGYGDGHFCGLGCGYQFGVALANHGRKLVPATSREDA